MRKSENILMRVTEADKVRLDMAAQLQGENLTQFIVKASVKRARHILRKAAMEVE